MKEEIQKTEIRMAEVRARFDPNQTGVFYAGIEGISDGASLMINYVSPYASAAKAGFPTLLQS